MSEMRPVKQAALDAVDFEVNEYNRGGDPNGEVVARHINAIDEQGNRSHVSIDDMLLTRGYDPDAYKEHKKEFSEDGEDHIEQTTNSGDEGEEQGEPHLEPPTATDEEKPYDWSSDEEMNTSDGKTPEKTETGESDFARRQKEIDRIIANRGSGEGDKRAKFEQRAESKEVSPETRRKFEKSIIDIVQSSLGKEWHNNDELMTNFSEAFYDFAEEKGWDEITKLRQLLEHTILINEIVSKQTPAETGAGEGGEPGVEGSNGNEGGATQQTPEKAEAIAGLNQELNNLFEELRKASSEDEMVQVKERLKDVTKKLFELEGKSEEDLEKALTSIDEFKLGSEGLSDEEKLDKLKQDIEEKYTKFLEALDSGDLDAAKQLKIELLDLFAQQADLEGLEQHVKEEILKNLDERMDNLINETPDELDENGEPTEKTRRQRISGRLWGIATKLRGKVANVFDRGGERMSKKRKVAILALGIVGTGTVVYLAAKGHIDINPWDGDGVDLNPFNNHPPQGGGGARPESLGGGSGGGASPQSPLEVQPPSGTGINPETGDLFRSDILMQVYDGKGAAQQFEMNGLVPQGYGQQLAQLLHDRGLDNGAHIPGFKDMGMWHTADGTSPWSNEAKQALLDFKAWMKL